MSDKKKLNQGPGPTSELSSFKSLAKRLLSVFKDEADKEAAKEAAERKHSE